MDMEIRFYRACKVAYHHLLQTPHDGLRAKNQTTLCLLRDAIAEYEQRDAQTVQDEHEEAALLERLVNR